MLIEVTEDEFFMEHKDHNKDPYDYQPATDIKIPSKILSNIENIMVNHNHNNHEYSTLHRIYFIMYNYIHGNHGISITQGINYLWIRSEYLNFEKGPYEHKTYYKCDSSGLEEYLTKTYKTIYI
jgi:hypothetical protein